MYFDAVVELLERYGVFCYNYFDSLAQLDKPELPPSWAFFNELDGVDYSQVDYA